MSKVTNVILHMGMLTEEEIPSTLQAVNAFFEGDQKGFVYVNDKSLPRGWYGGSKMLEADLAIGAFNHLNLDKLIQHLRGVRWDPPEDVQLIVKEQDDNTFRIIDVFA